MFFSSTEEYFQFFSFIQDDQTYQLLTFAALISTEGGFVTTGATIDAYIYKNLKKKSPGRISSSGDIIKGLVTPRDHGFFLSKTHVIEEILKFFFDNILFFFYFE